MKLLVLAAGYATRLYPLTLTRPKPLLEVAGRPILDRVIENLATIEGIDETLVVANHRFASQFEDWAKGHAPTVNHPIRVIDDGCEEPEQRLGAIGDLRLVLDQTGMDDDLIVVAGDNLFSQSLEGFGEYCRELQMPVLGVYDVGRLDAAKAYSEVHADMEGQITSFEEKPEAPTTTLVGIALYYFPRSVLSKVRNYLDGGNDPDKPGRFIQWLYPRHSVYTWAIPGIWYDIGSKETLAEADRIFQGR